MIGYRAGGRPQLSHPKTWDVFELPRAAVECARILLANGWTSVFCEAVLADRNGVERCEPLQWRG